MSNRARRHLSSLAGAVVAVATLLELGTGARALPPDAASAETVTDEGKLLTPPQRVALERSLRAQAATSGSPLAILLVRHLARHDSIASLARRTFAGRGLDAAGPPRVLLVVAVDERRAAIETGQGPAGIVPEVDGRRIVADLESGLARRRLAPALGDAAAAIAASARATAERRRPLPPDPLEPRPPASPVAPVDLTSSAPPATGTRPDGAPGPAPQPGEAGGRSLVPTAALVSAGVVLGLALRRRRRLAEERAAQPPPRPPEPKGRGTVKSVGDRPMS